MGVEGLYPHVRSSIQETFKFDKVNPNLDPTFDYKEIIFDGTCWLWRYMKGNYCMDYLLLKETCQKMVTNFQKYGFKLVVFMDANICFNKLDTWLNRRSMRSNFIFEFNKLLKKNKGTYPNSYFGNDRYWFAPNGCYFFIGQLFKLCGCKVFYSHIDCDREMIGYYKLYKNINNIYGICSVDSDFLIFDIDIYLEMNTMQFNCCNKFIIKGVKHENMLKRFQLKQFQLSQLAAIMGCDVIQRSSQYIQTIYRIYKKHISFSHGEVDVIARFLRDSYKNQQKKLLKQHQQKKLQLDIDQNPNKTDVETLYNSNGHQLNDNNNGNKMDLNTNTIKTKNKKNKKKRSRNGKKHKKRDISNVSFSKNIKRKFAISQNFYTPIFPLDLLDHPYLIMLLFQEYNDCKEEEQNDNNNKYIRGVIIDSCMDDTSLLHPKQCSAVILSKLRKYLYAFLVTDDNMDNDIDMDDKTNNELKMKEIICYPFQKYNFQPTLLANKWKQGIVIKLNHNDNSMTTNPLLQMKSYNFVKDLDNNQSNDVSSIPPDLIVEDIIFLLKWLKTTRIISKTNENDQKMDVDHDINSKDLQQNNINKVSTTYIPTKNEKKRRKKQKLEWKKQQLMNMLNNRNYYHSTTKSRSALNDNDDDTITDKNSMNKMWNDFDLILDSFLFQWKYRNIFLCNPYRNHIIYQKSRCNEYKKKYSKKMSPISMHFQSIIFGIYEIIFSFLRLNTNNKWYKNYYLMTHKKLNTIANDMPTLKLQDNGIQETCNKINTWKQMLLSSANCRNVEIPYCWDIFNVKLYHWIFHQIDLAKQWISECDNTNIP